MKKMISPNPARSALSALFALIIVLSYSTKAAVTSAGNNSIHLKQEQVKDFDGIASGGSIDVVIRLGNSESIRFEGDREAIAELITEKEDGVLVIKPRSKKWGDWEKRHRNASVTAYITARKLRQLIMAGSGNMSVEGTISGSSLSAVLSGSGKISATANTTGKLEGAISGSGSIDIGGSAGSAEVAISGSGNFNARNLRVSNLQAAISGSGNIAMTVSKSLDAAISGSGNIRYAGNPAVQQRVAGSGSVRKL
ncbi:head GIN domain-containing protein [Pedobacter sp. SYP-B3415]|uniref:head GIN domain-containing protein n=1 Tax=Pedobacter sp. SYP-B3415 TaxID=2496641 RepID=UPI00101C41D6|nr:head GIN domain-containing protein [Pedobacter sp. SYP-B3415]